MDIIKRVLQILLPFLVAIAFATAMESCPLGAKNCIRTAWTPPSGTSKKTMAQTVREVLFEYPQAGQNGIDNAGWKITEDKLRSTGTAHVEYMNVGIFAKILNGGNPFVDDLLLEIGDKDVQVRSASRMGKSDLGVNQKRLTFFADALRNRGWEVPPPKY